MEKDGKNSTRLIHSKHLHYFIAEVVDDFDGDAAGRGSFEEATRVAVGANLGK